MTVELDPTDELLACLEVLGDYLAETPVVEAEYDDAAEHNAAICGLLQHVPSLMEEYSMAWRSLVELREMVNGLQGQLETLTAEKARSLWTPDVKHIGTR